MDDLMLRMSGGFSGSFDLTAFIAFIAYGVVYFLAPVLGYDGYRRSAMAMAMYLMVGYGGASLIQLLVQWAQMLDRDGPGAFGLVRIMIGFAVLKLILFLASMVAFIAGLQALRLRRPRSDAEHIYDPEHQGRAPRSPDE